MQTSTAASTRSFMPLPLCARSQPSGAGWALHGVAAHGGKAQRDGAFIALLDAYRPTGGLMRSSELAQRLACRDAGDPAGLARSIADGEILWFDWNGTTWLPSFQLDPDTLAVGRATRRVLAELSGALDGWSAAHWFVMSHARLHGCSPVELLGSHLDDVIDAARATRLIAWTCAGRQRRPAAADRR